MANDTAINVTDWATRIAYSSDSQALKWVAGIILGLRGRSNPFNDLIGGINDMKPVMEVMDFRKLQGQEIIMTLDRPLGGEGTQGAASTTKLVGREENVRHATFRAKVGLMAHAVAGEQVLYTQAVIGTDWDKRQKQKLKEWFAWKQADDFQFECFKRAHARNTLFPNGKTSRDQLTGADYMSLSTVGSLNEILAANQAKPMKVTKSKAGADIFKYLLVGPQKAYRGMVRSNSYQNLLSQAGVRGDANYIFNGGLPSFEGTDLYSWQVEDGTQVGALGCPLAPIAYLGVAMPATSDTDLSNNPIIGGGNATNAADTSAPFFRYFSNAAYTGHEGEKIAAVTDVTRYVAIKVISGADAGKIALFSYTTNNGNRLTGLKRLGAMDSGDILDDIGSVHYDANGFTLAADGNGFAGLTTGILPVGSIIYEVNAKGQPFTKSLGLGRDAILAGYGSIAAGAGEVPGQRLEDKQDYGRISGLGYQQVWGCRAVENADNMVNGYVLIESAYTPDGWPSIT